jgi:hypothetical protein
VGVKDGVKVNVGVKVKVGVKVGVGVDVKLGVNVGVSVHESAVTVSAAKVMLTCCSREGPHPASRKQVQIVRTKITLRSGIFRMGL